ncbi:MAG: hypothetical protein HQK77_13680 [Desulfobacterales bacterium]|nr:hypothetical protein [Desulfobacterales bacterium]
MKKRKIQLKPWFYEMLIVCWVTFFYIFLDNDIFFISYTDLNQTPTELKNQTLLLAQQAKPKKNQQNQTKPEDWYANPDWVHPNHYKDYPGYKANKEQKQENRDWEYSTNRPGGNTRGGGTVEYNKYKPFYRPTF